LKKPTAFYLRVSTDEQSFASQRAALYQAFAQRWPNDPNPIIFKETASGRKAKRTELGKVMDLARAGEISRILVYKLDRWGRSSLHMLQTILELSKYKVPLIAIADGIDTSNDSPMAQVQLGMFRIFAEYEAAMISARTTAGVKAAAAAGRFGGRPSKFEERSPKVMKLLAQGKSARAIALEMKIPFSSAWNVIQQINGKQEAGFKEFENLKPVQKTTPRKKAKNTEGKA
jgi:DNA invertase Pin-like site-specific DNA recombinase